MSTSKQKKDVPASSVCWKAFVGAWTTNQQPKTNPETKIQQTANAL
jgi:hypothetical protein